MRWVVDPPCGTSGSRGRRITLITTALLVASWVAAMLVGIAHRMRPECRVRGGGECGALCTGCHYVGDYWDFIRRPPLPRWPRGRLPMPEKDPSAYEADLDDVRCRGRLQGLYAVISQFREATGRWPKSVAEACRGRLGGSALRCPLGPVYVLHRLPTPGPWVVCPRHTWRNHRSRVPEYVTLELMPNGSVDEVFRDEFEGDRPLEHSRIHHALPGRARVDPPLVWRPIPVRFQSAAARP